MNMSAKRLKICDGQADFHLISLETRTIHFVCLKTGDLRVISLHMKPNF